MNCRVQAKKIYSLCINRTEPVTYGDVLAALEYRKGVSGFAIRYGLELVLLACLDKKLPILTAIVVNSASGRPTPPRPVGKGVNDPNNNWAAQTRNVFNYRGWPKANQIDWEDIWARRYELSAAAHGTKGYWPKVKL